jgi:penicillin-binding protein 1C
MSQRPRQQDTRRIFSPETASLIGSILSDPEARRLEFGHDSLLRFPVQTAVKTGTSSDYRDAWAAGFNHRYTVGVWIGNLDHRATDGITGSNGPAMILRSIFAELNRHRNTHPLYLSPRLVKAEICRDSGLAADDRCTSLSEWFVSGTEPKKNALPPANKKPVYLQHPTQGMQLAMDPRIAENQQAFVFKLANLPKGNPVDWYVDKKRVASLSTGKYSWILQPGKHSVRARIWSGNLDQFRETAEVNIIVK